MADELTGETNGTEVTVDFVRHRNALLVRGDFSPLFIDYYLHLAEQGLAHTAAQDVVFKEALAAFTLHCGSRPLNEHVAWTINLQQPLLNVFLAGDNEDCTVVGRVFTDNVKAAPTNMFYSDTLPRRGAAQRRRVVDFQGADVFVAAQAYYLASEQRPVRYFHLGEDEYAMLVSHPDCDLPWLQALEVGGVRDLGRTETLTRIDRRLYRWSCGCTHQKILGAIAPAFRSDPDGVFGEGESIRVQCPRCAAAHILTREALEAYLAQTPRGGGA